MIHISVDIVLSVVADEVSDDLKRQTEEDIVYVQVCAMRYAQRAMREDMLQVVSSVQGDADRSAVPAGQWQLVWLPCAHTGCTHGVTSTMDTHAYG